MTNVPKKPESRKIMAVLGADTDGDGVLGQGPTIAPE